MKRVLTIILILAVVIGASVWSYQYMTPAKPQSLADDPTIEIVPVSRDTLYITVDASGRIQPQTEVKMKFETGGMVSQVLVKRGQWVTAGAVLARLDATDMELAARQAEVSLVQQKAELARLYEPPLAEKVTAARAEVKRAQVKLAEIKTGPTQDEITAAEAELSVKKIALKKAQWAYDEVSYLGEIGAMPQADQLQQATIDYEAALAAYNQRLKGPTAADLTDAETQLVQAQSALAELLKQPSAADILSRQAAIDNAQLDLAQKKRALERAVLVAPKDGLVTAVNIEPGERALNDETNPAIILDDTSRYLLKVEVDEIDIGRVKAGQPVTVTLDALAAKAFSGQVDDIAPRSSTTDPNAIVTYEVTITFDNSDPALRTGMTANATIEVERLENALVAPNRAINTERSSGKTTAYVEKMDEQGNPVRVEVALGLRDLSVTQIMGGLEDGDRLIIRNVSKPGQPTPTPGDQTTVKN